MQIVLIDEATAHVDSATQSAVYRLLHAVLPAATLLCITHRSRDLDFFDVVIALENARVVFVGAPANRP
jgi:ATP-binding cassette subfamily B protein